MFWERSLVRRGSVVLEYDSALGQLGRPIELQQVSEREKKEHDVPLEIPQNGGLGLGWFEEAEVEV